MMLSNVIVDVTIPRCSFVFGQSRAKVSAGFTNVRSLAVAAFDLVYCSLSVLRFVFVLDISKQVSCLLMSRTKTNRRTDREQYTRSNAATARLLTLVKPAETLARD